MNESAWYPVLLDVRGRRCLVVGAGTVGARKAQSLLAAGALVTLMGVALSDEATRLGSHPGVELVQRAYRSSDLDGMWFVVTAMDDRATTAAVYDDAQRARVWMNAADDPRNCSAILPAVHRDGDVTFAVSTGGASPATAGWLRDRVAGHLGDLPGRLTFAVGLVRDRVRVHRTSEGLPWRTLVDRLAREGTEDLPVIANEWLSASCEPSSCGACTTTCRALFDLP